MQSHSFHQHLKSILALSLSMAVLTAFPTAAAEKAHADKAKAHAETTAPKPDWYPFHGDVASVNKSENTISLKKKEGERVIHLDAKSELTKAGKSITLTDVKPGSYAHGKLHKDSKGNEVITAAAFDASAPKAPASPTPTPKPNK